MNVVKKQQADYELTIKYMLSLLSQWLIDFLDL